MENTLNEKELNDVFLDVRKSYRLLYLYQRRVMDLVQFIGTRYEFEPRNGHPFMGSNNQKILPNHSSWDYLLLYNCPIRFNTKSFGKYNNVELLITIVSDTGLFDVTTDWWSENTKHQIEQFNSVEKSKTQIHIKLKTTGTPWTDYINNCFPADKADFFVKKDNPEDFLIGKKYDLSNFMNEESTIKQLEDFEEFCRENGIVLRPKEKEEMEKENVS